MCSKEERPCILLVEDDRLTRTVLRHDLKLHGFEVDIAENGDVALKKLQKATKHGKVGYDLVLTDVFMPKVDGETLVRSVTADFRNQLPVAVMSANCAESDKNRLLKSGASEYLVKPIQSESLAQLRRLVPSKVARDTQESTLPAHEELKHNSRAPAEQTVLCSCLLEAANQATSVLGQQEKEAHEKQEPPSAQAVPAEHSTESESTGMGVQDDHGARTPNPQTQPCPKKAQPAADGANASSGYDTSNPCIISPLHTQDTASGSPMLNVAVVVPAGTSPMDTEQATVKAPASDEQEPVSVASQQLVSAATFSTFCAQIVPAQVTFISSAANMAPIATRKAALVRFREKKARSHFALKVRYHERKKLAEARPRYKGQFVKLEQLPKEQQQAIAQAKAAVGAVTMPDNETVKA